MANSIDMGAIVLGAAIGYGLRKEIKSASSVCKAGLLAGLGVATAAVAAAVEQEKKAPAAGATQSVGQNGGKNEN